jgi:hypothetical protein
MEGYYYYGRGYYGDEPRSLRNGDTYHANGKGHVAPALEPSEAEAHRLRAHASDRRSSRSEEER